jgi:transcriptional regulator with XRE-family HTH domain
MISIFTSTLVDKLTYQLAMNLTSRQKLSQLLLDLRGSKSRRAFAREIGVTATAVIAWENADSEPDMKHLTTIAKLAGYTLDELRVFLGDSEHKRTSKIPFSRILTETSQLSIQEAAQLYRAVGDRLVAIAESAGR